MLSEIEDIESFEASSASISSVEADVGRLRFPSEQLVSFGCDGRTNLGIELTLCRIGSVLFALLVPLVVTHVVTSLPDVTDKSVDDITMLACVQSSTNH